MQVKRITRALEYVTHDVDLLSTIHHNVEDFQIGAVSFRTVVQSRFDFGIIDRQRFAFYNFSPDFARKVHAIRVVAVWSIFNVRFEPVRFA